MYFYIFIATSKNLLLMTAFNSLYQSAFLLMEIKHYCNHKTKILSCLTKFNQR